MASTPPEAPPEAPPEVRPETRPGPRAEACAVFGIALIAYLVIARWAIVDHNLVMGDAISRLGNATYALDSRYAHLSAIGFVWGPIPTLTMLPTMAVGLVPHTSWFVPSVSSCVFMAASVAVVNGIGRGWGLTRAWRLATTLFFATNPMIVFYAVNGMSEAYFILFLLLAANRLSAWIVDDRSGDLALAGLWLGFGYLVRYEALAAAGAAAGMVALVGGWHTWMEHADERDLRERGKHVSGRVGLDVAVLVMPVVTAVAAFALVSWIVTGQAFAQFSSTYGNSSVIQATAPAATGLSALRFSIGELAGAGPLALPLVCLAALWLDKERRSRALGLVGVFGGVLALTALLQVTGKTLPFLRFWIAAIPLEVLLLGLLAAQWAQRPRRAHRLQSLRAVAAVGGLVALVAATFSITWSAMTNTIYGVQEHQIATVVEPWRDRFDERQTLAQFTAERRLAAYLDALRLPAGSVLVDVLDGFPVVAASRDPRQFVIPSDFDFAQALSDPVHYGVRYLLTVPDAGRGANDALNMAFPGVYDNGLPGSRLLLQVDSGDLFPDWRLYRLASSR